MPLDAPELHSHDEETTAAAPRGATSEVSRRITTADTQASRTHLLSNGQYAVMLTNSGAGYSTCRGLAVTRWRTDPTRDCHGTFLYLRDTATGKQWSAGHQPLATPADSYEVIFSTDKAEIRRRDGDIETQVEVTVAPDADARDSPPHARQSRHAGPHAGDNQPCGSRAERPAGGPRAPGVREAVPGNGVAVATRRTAVPPAAARRTSNRCSRFTSSRRIGPQVA